MDQTFWDNVVTELAEINDNLELYGSNNALMSADFWKALKRSQELFKTIKFYYTEEFKNEK